MTIFGIGLLCAGLLFGPNQSHPDREAVRKRRAAEENQKFHEYHSRRRHHSPTNSSLATATHAYWQNAVCPLVQARYSPIDSDDSASGLAARLTRRFEEAFKQFKKAPTKRVDPDVVNLFRKHIADDEAYMGRLAELRKSYPDYFQLVAKAEAELPQYKEIEADLSRLVEAASSGDYDDAPEPTRSLMREAILADEREMDQLIDIEVLQARLQERYPGYRFELPDLGGEVEDQ